MANVPWGLVAFLVGIAYGYFAPGRQDKSELFKRAMLWAVVVALVLAVVGWLFETNPVGITGVGILGFLVAALVIVLLFLLGVWIGDWLEHRKGATSVRGRA